MRHCVSLCFIVLFMFLYDIVSGQLAFLLLINNNNVRFVSPDIGEKCVFL